MGVPLDASSYDALEGRRRPADLICNGLQREEVPTPRVLLELGLEQVCDVRRADDTPPTPDMDALVQFDAPALVVTRPCNQVQALSERSEERAVDRIFEVCEERSLVGFGQLLRLRTAEVVSERLVDLEPLCTVGARKPEEVGSGDSRRGDVTLRCLGERPGSCAFSDGS